MMMSVSQLLVAALERQGVRFVFGLPGDENLPFVEAVRASDRLEFVLTRHEAAAGFMAAAHGYQTGQLAVAMSTLGAGATNLVTPVAHAWLAEMPMIALTGQRQVIDNQQGRYQLIDVPAIMRPITKYSASVPSAQALPGIIADAMHQALEYPQGPVHIELPVDIGMLDAGDTTLLPTTVAPSPGPAPAAIAATVERLRGAKRPLVLIGSGANNRPSVSPALRSFLDATDLPFVSTMMGKGVADETTERFVGTSAMPEMDFAHCAIQHADLVVSVGHNVMEKAPFTMTPNGPDVIHIHEMSATPDTIWFPDLQVIGDMSLAFDALTAAIAPLPSWDLDGFAALAAAMREAIRLDPAHLDAGPLVKPQVVAAAVRSALADDDVVSLDNGIHKLWLTRNYPASSPRTVMVDSALGAMGPGIPAAIAAKLALPDRRVAAVVGDGGFSMSSQELETAVRLGLDLSVLVLNDSGLGMIRLKQMMMGLDNHGVDFANPDIAALADAYGAHGHTVTDAASFGETLDAAFAAGGVHVFDIPIDYGENPGLLMAMRSIDCAAIIAQ